MAGFLLMNISQRAFSSDLWLFQINKEFLALLLRLAHLVLVAVDLALLDHLTALLLLGTAVVSLEEDHVQDDQKEHVDVEEDEVVGVVLGL